jgi:hypothetical protein
VYTLGLLIPCFNHVSGRDGGAVGSGTEDVAMILSLGNSASAGEVSIDDPGGLPSRDVWHGSARQVPGMATYGTRHEMRESARKNPPRFSSS